MKHFEDIWEESEKASDSLELNKRIININNLLRSYKDNKDPIIIGELLFQISGITKDDNINVAAALNEVLNDIKIDKYE